MCNFKLIQPGINSLVDTDSELAREWSPNEERKPNEFHKYSKYYALWKCPTCHGDYTYPINERKVGDNSCPYCNNRKVLPHFNSLYARDRELAKEWSSNNELPAEQILRITKQYGLWNCPICQGEYSYRIEDRYVGDNSCPYCNNQKPLTGYNTLETVLDNIDLIWSSANDRHYTELLPSSSYNAEWKCNICNGFYKETVNSFIKKHLSGEDDCPYCNNRKPLAGFNTLKVKCQNLMKEWNYRSNYLIVDPDTILSTYPEEVWWTCECGKNYKMSPKKRMYYQKRNMKSCPYCKGRRRKKHYNF